MDYKKFEIVPDVLPSVADDTEEMQVSYGGITVAAGTEIAPSQSLEEPNVSWISDENKFYTLFMVDPDAPSRDEPLYREFIHWVVTDIPGSDVKSGVVVVDYMGPAPPHASGIHRYCFLAYEQKEKGVVNVDETKKLFEGRGGKKIMDLVTKSDLGQPIAGNLMTSQWEKECDRLHEVMGWLPPEKYRSPTQQNKSPKETAEIKDEKEAKPQRAQEPQQSKASTIDKTCGLFPTMKWANTKSEILVKIVINNAKKVKLEFTNNSLTFSACSGEKIYDFSRELFSNIVGKESTWKVKNYYVDITMVKETKKERWCRLIKSSGRNNKIATDWDRLEDWDSDEDDTIVNDVDDDFDDDTEDDEEEEKPKKKKKKKEKEEEKNTSWYSPLLSPFTACRRQCCGSKKKKD